MIKVLAFALYGPLAASTRYRLGQYMPGLKAFDIDLQICHLLGDEYLQRRFDGGAWPLATMARAGMHRLADLWSLPAHDLAMLHCELFPLLPGPLERALFRRPYLYDFDDAFYLKYRSPRFRAVQPLLRNKFDAVIGGAAAVTAGNQVLQHYAARFNPHTTYLPTVVDTSRYVPTGGGPRSGPFTVGWIGSPSTAPYLTELVEPLSALAQDGPVRFIVIGGKAPAIPDVEVVEVAWREDTEVALIGGFDVGVMPLPDDDWARGKCAFKLIQYMACGVPVVASPVGANVDVLDGDCGLLAATPQAWAQALRQLRDDPLARRRYRQAGRERVVRDYSLARNLPVLAETIRQVAGRR